MATAAAPSRAAKCALGSSVAAIVFQLLALALLGVSLLAATSSFNWATVDMTATTSTSNSLCRTAYGVNTCWCAARRGRTHSSARAPRGRLCTLRARTTRERRK
jgi:hypothetical protein